MNIRLTPNETARLEEIDRAVENLQDLQTRLQEARDSELRHALIPGMNTAIVRQNLTAATLALADYDNLRNAEVLLSNIAYDIRTHAEHRSAEDFRRLTGA